MVAADTWRARTGQQLAEGSLQVQGGDGGHGDQVSGYLDMVDSVVWMLAKLLRAATGCCDLTGVAGAAGLTHWRLETEAGLGWAGLGWAGLVTKHAHNHNLHYPPKRKYGDVE